MAARLAVPHPLALREKAEAWLSRRSGSCRAPCFRAPSLRRRRSAWLRACSARCWCTRHRHGHAGRQNRGGRGLPGPAQRPARSGRPLLSRPHAAQRAFSLVPPGYAYVYAIYGRYFCMNVSCEIEGQAGCVLLRALEPSRGLCPQMALNRGLAARRTGPAAHLRPQPPLPGARPHAPSPQRPRPARSRFAASVARRRLSKSAKCW